MKRKKQLGAVEISEELFEEVKKETKNLPDLKEKIKNSLDKTTTELLDIILSGGINLLASDIHLEPQKDQARLRLRLDGILQNVIYFDKKTYKSLLSRIKLISKVKLNVADKPQDGRFSISIKNEEVETRTSTLPAEHGESVVMRILNPKNLMSLEELGLEEDLLKTFKREIERANGMIIVTGPTGSGKTTTLYAFLRYLQNPEIKIITIEDPIEYHLRGISQTQVAPKKGYTFSNGLESIVRQDPDVILVGEVRDKDTASIALQAALTGHLVFATLHTNDAAGTIPRLMDLGSKPATIGPAVNMAVAQRLLRKVCKECVKMRKTTSKELKELKEALKNLPNNIKLPELNKDLKIPKTEGCKHCNFTGYKGRKGVFEAFLVDDEMEEFISKNPPVSKIQKLATKKGMITMYQRGLIDVLSGITTLEEVKRTIE